LALVEGERWFAAANQWCVFDSRMNLASLDLTTLCCQEYLDFEADRTWGLTPEEDMPLLRLVARDLFGPFDIRDYPFRPKHGNGSTAELPRKMSDPWHKNRHFAVDGEIITYLRHRVTEEEWQDYFYLPYRGLDRTSKLVCVPKSTTKNRTISKEPTTLQYLQQDVFAALDDYFVEHMHGHIDLHDQGRSRELALRASFDGSYATIDLSAASDSVSLALVEQLFDGLPILYPLVATRSTHVDVRDKSGEIAARVRTRKFAPMGSATCFPTECMIFSIICDASIRRSSGRKPRFDDYVVYGDDIVIRTEYAAECVALLIKLGFRVNADKSFIDESLGCSLFREACGVEAFAGEDVTPLRIGRRLVSVTDNDSDHQAGLGVGLVEFYNETFLHGFTTLRRWLNGELIRHKWYRTILRISETDYYRFRDAIILSRTPWVPVAMPFVITTDMSDTQWRCFGARSVLDGPYHVCMARVTTAKSRRSPAHHDSNDYFSWCMRSRCQTTEDPIFEVDGTGLVTIRPPT
jgi:hypothetical protein